MNQIDASRLPADVVALIEALGPGEELTITRDDRAIATISSTRNVHDDDVLGHATPDQPTEAAYGDVTVVATAMKLSAAARRSLSAELGTDYIVLDMHAAPNTADVLLVPPVSPQLIASLRSMFPRARLVITEIEDPELGVSYHGPIRRLLDAGADNYLAATAVPQLARQLDHAVTRRDQLTGTASSRLTIEAARED
jgi:antitoxin (DNA-binding transcriptional repressor) of toxin-antitoxin stability system